MTMTITRNMKIGIGVAIVALVIGIGSYVFIGVRNSQTTESQQAEDGTSAQLPVAESVPLNTGDDAESAVEVQDTNNETQKETIVRMSRIVIERYGSFSNRNNFENIVRLEPYMTEDFRKKSLEFIDEQQSGNIDESFYGISTTAVSLELTDFTKEESATVRIATRRQETKGDEGSSTFTQYANVFFVYVSGNWKVDDIQWE